VFEKPTERVNSLFRSEPLQRHFSEQILDPYIIEKYISRIKLDELPTSAVVFTDLKA
jgi:hypothetical protein